MYETASNAGADGKGMLAAAAAGAGGAAVAAWTPTESRANAVAVRRGATGKRGILENPREWHEAGARIVRLAARGEVRSSDRTVENESMAQGATRRAPG